MEGGSHLNDDEILAYDSDDMGTRKAITAPLSSIRGRASMPNPNFSRTPLSINGSVPAPNDMVVTDDDDDSDGIVMHDDIETDDDD